MTKFVVLQKITERNDRGRFRAYSYEPVYINSSSIVSIERYEIYCWDSDQEEKAARITFLSDWEYFSIIVSGEPIDVVYNIYEQEMKLEEWQEIFDCKRKIKNVGLSDS